MFLLFLLLHQVILMGAPGEMVILRSKEHGMYTLIYKADQPQDVHVRITNIKGEKRLEHKVSGTSGFSLPINMKKEESGMYRVVITAGEYSIQKDFSHTEYKDLIKEYFTYEYDQERHKISVSCSEIVDVPVDIYVFNERGDQLIKERVKASHSVSRVFDLNGAPAVRLELIIHADNTLVLEDKFSY